MKTTIGIILIAAGCIFGYYSINLDTSVPVPTQYGGEERRVNNIGAMNDKQNYIFIAGILFLSGMVLVAGDNENVVKELRDINKHLTGKEN